MAAEITLSSRLTFTTKVVVPVLWISVFGIVTGVLWFCSGVPLDTKWLFLVVWGIGALSFWWICIPLKKVRVIDDSLYFSNYRKEIVVPLVFVDRVTENRWVNVHPVTIYFRRDTEFGSKIMFMPFWRSHPVVGEIGHLVETAERGKA